MNKKPLVILSIGVFSLFSLLIIQYFKIQILEGEKWSKIALSQHECVVKEPFRRGSFYTCLTQKKKGGEKTQPLVIDVTKFHLFVDPLSIPSIFHKQVAISVSSKLLYEAQGIEKELKKQSRNRKLASLIDKSQKDEIEKWWLNFAKTNKIAKNALYFTTDYQRSYPYGKLLGQVLHTIRETKEEITDEGVPTGGLESYFNDLLKGKQGKRILVRSPLNKLDTDKIAQAPENGADVYLTIHHVIQAIAEEELEKGVKAANAKGGWAIMMDPFTGEILALAQYPFFDPTHYKEFFNDPEKIEDSKVRSITDAFELGSIMKPITFAICLKANDELAAQGRPLLFDPLQPIDTTRSLFPGRASKPLKDTRFHKKLNMNMALQKSSNVYMAQLIERVVSTMGNDWYRKTLIEDFGFGKKTGIELPAEAVGLVPRPGKLHPNGALEWSLSTPYSLAMGHNILATNLQMLKAYAIFANGGFLVQPTLVKKVVKTDEFGHEKILIDNTSSERKKNFKRVLSKEACTKVIHSLKFVTKPGGTARFGEIPGYSEAGKTGTAEKVIEGVYSKKHFVSSFIGFAPANTNDPQVAAKFVLCVTLDDPEKKILEDGTKAHHGGKCSGPIFREISKRTLEYFGIEPDDPYGYPPGDPRYNCDKADWGKEVRELKLLYEQWNKP